MSLLKAACFHEAAHAVIAAKLGCSVHWAWANDERGGRMAYSVPRSARDDAVILFSGTLAQFRACPGTPLGQSDARAVSALDPHMALHWRREARALVDRHWTAVEDVATRLLEAGRLEGHEINWACSGVRAEWCT